LSLKFKAGEFWISAIKKNGQNYQLDFSPAEWKELETIRNFLDMDTEVRFIVTDPKRLRSPVKGFWSDLAFMEYMKGIFNTSLKKNHWKKKLKIKLKK
jgi:hypothetical protein